MKSSTALLTIIFGCSLILNAQKPDFKFKRKIESIQAPGWYQIKLPDDIPGRTQPRFQDIRIFSLKNADTLEVPFLLKIQEDVITEQAITVPIINKSTKDKKLFLTFDMKRERVNYVNLEFSEKNFDGVATIEGSNDQKEWFSILEKRRILSISDQDIDFGFTTLNFPLSNYHFLRIQIEANKPLNLNSASLSKREAVPGKQAKCRSHGIQHRIRKSSRLLQKYLLNKHH